MHECILRTLCLRRGLIYPVGITMYKYYARHKYSAEYALYIQYSTCKEYRIIQTSFSALSVICVHR